jgi:cysteinyl-tRNA synthetase
MKIYNTLTKNKEEFIPLKKNKVKIYSCGPTVYSYAHIGNLRTYLNVDFLRRWLEFKGYEVEMVMNITDIEDKIIRDSIEQNIDFHVITEKYEKYFVEHIKKLNVELPEKMPRATEEIDEMIKIINKLLEDNIAYKSDDGSIYFSVSKFKDYGKLSGAFVTSENQESRISSDDYDKENAQDFALWKAAKPDEPSWEAPFGKGRPGWHIECSAMSMKYLGETIDIHAGGIDLVFPHHENEIAQSETYSGKKFANYWFHCEHLLIESDKMSKSKQNYYTVDDLKEKFNVELLAFRMLCLMSHYRERLNFTKESIQQAQNTLNGLRDFVAKLNESRDTDISDLSVVETLIESTKKDFTEALEDDLSMPKALSSIFNLKNEVNKLFIQGVNASDSKKLLDFIFEIDKVLGLNLEKPEIKDERINKLFDKYILAKMNKDYAISDKIREELSELGWIAEDHQGASRLRKK